jgi:hypothetical protein
MMHHFVGSGVAFATNGGGMSASRAIMEVSS